MRTAVRRFCDHGFGATLALVLLAGCADDQADDAPVFEAPETAVTYEVAVDGLPDEEMLALSEASLAVFRQQDKGAQSLAFLKRRAEGDIALLQKLLRSQGYFTGEVDLKVSGDDDAPAQVQFQVTPGPQFTLRRHTFQLDDPSGSAPVLDAADLGSPVGEGAVAAGIVDAETAAVDKLQRSGFPYAARGKRRAVADRDATSLEIDTPVRTGPQAIFGTVTFGGLVDVRERYLRTYLPWSNGDTVDLSLLRDYQRSLLGTDLFDTVSVKLPEAPPDLAGPIALPVSVTVEERAFRTVSAGGRYSTDDGPSVTAGFEHRNLFGENETLSVEAELGIQVQEFGIGYREPQYMRPGQDLLASFVATREEDDAFDQLTATATLGLQRRLNDRWIVGAGGLLEASQITDQGVETLALLAGIPAFAEYDSSDDQLDPSEGARLRLEVTPFAGSFDGEFAGFLTIDATASTYYDILGDRAYILAGRARLGSILTDELDTVPQTRRLYSGGGGSVRGFAQRFVGPLDSLNDPIGGLSAVELGGELRARLFGDLGGVVFVDAGAVGEESAPTFNEGVQVAAGVGFRYFSPAGPIRVDVALPLNPRDADDAFQLYFSIGQAF
ncbi:MAG: autotransporter assembly complex family protein [Pseudomonadota bacterium]